MILRPMLGQGIGLLLQEGMQVFLVLLRQECGRINVLTLSIGFKFLRGDGCRQMKLFLHLMQGKAMILIIGSRLSSHIGVRIF